ncbi:hypothetical protein HGM15179_008862, partial [Zosterops borbonicus]
RLPQVKLTFMTFSTKSSAFLLCIKNVKGPLRCVRAHSGRTDPLSWFRRGEGGRGGCRPPLCRDGRA